MLVGGGPEAVELIRALRDEPTNDIRICGIFDDREDARVPAMQEGLPKLGRIDELLEFGRQAEVDMLIVALPMAAEQRLVQLLKTLWVLPVDIRLSARASRLRFRPRSYSYVGAVPFLDLFDKPIADWDYVAKACFDRIVGSILLLLLSPVMLAVALAVKLDSPGPALFRQKRYGFNNELIEVFKFRSMYADKTDANAAKLATRNDPRITRVGRFIRKTSLDELPQLINVVFKGNLSLVGPRPHAAAGEGRRPPLRAGRRRLFRAPSRQARHHRLGAGQRLARRDRHAGEARAARRARPLLHRELVGHVRPLHSPADAVQAAEHGERVLSATWTVAAQPTGMPDQSLRQRRCSGWRCSSAASSSCEPAPYDLFLAAADPGLDGGRAEGAARGKPAGRADAPVPRRRRHRRHAGDASRRAADILCHHQRSWR